MNMHYVFLLFCSFSTHINILQMSWYSIIPYPVSNYKQEEIKTPAENKQNTKKHPSQQKKTTPQKKIDSKKKNLKKKKSDDLKRPKKTEIAIKKTKKNKRSPINKDNFF